MGLEYRYGYKEAVDGDIRGACLGSCRICFWDRLDAAVVGVRMLCLAVGWKGSYIMRAISNIRDASGNSGSNSYLWIMSMLCYNYTLPRNKHHDKVPRPNQISSRAIWTISHRTESAGSSG
jgi:hypothetical protein